MNTKIETSDCTICAEKYNRSTRCPIVCMHCEFTACMSCAQTYILSEPVPKCMNMECGKEWTRHFMSRQFPKTFMKGKWRDHVASQLYELEKAQLPRSQITVELVARRDAEQERLVRISKELRDLQRQYDEAQFSHGRLAQRVRRRLAGLDGDDNNDDTSERRKFTRNCPAADCRGFLSQQWKCGLCNIWACPECHEVIGLARDVPHECKPENVESAKEVMKSTKPCPKCATPIYRIEGCPQMWCTMCNTAFNWNTGKAYDQNANIHNPHYFEYLRSRDTNAVGPNPNPMQQCGGLRIWREFTHHLMSSYTSRTNRQRGVRSNQPLTEVDKAYQYASSIIHDINHIEDIDLPRFDTRHVTNELTRCEYLNQKIDETEFKKRLASNIRKKQKNDAYYQLFQMFVEASKDITRRYGTDYLQRNMEDTNYGKITEEYKNEMEALIQYCNAQSVDISETFDMENYYEIADDISIQDMRMRLEIKPKKREKTGRKKNSSTV